MTPTERSSTRIAPLDWVRALAIILALVSHVMIITGGWSMLEDAAPDGYLAARAFTRTATPTFVLLAGAAVELAYARTWRTDRRRGVRRLLAQSLKCLLGLAIIGIAAVISGMLSPSDLMWSLIGVRAVPNAEIFTFYVVFFVIAVPLVAFRIRFGLPATLLLVAAWWPAAALIPAPREGSPRLAIARIFGIGDMYGPSAFHALLLAVVGMVLAAALRDRSGRSFLRRWWLFACCVAVAAGVVVTLVVQDGPGEVVRSYVTATAYRFTNHPGYFAIGLLAAGGVLLAAYAVWSLVFHRAAIEPGPFGGDSLIAFTLGNAAINLLGGALRAPSLSVAIASSVLLVLATWCLVRAFRALRPKSGTRSGDRSALGAPTAPQRSGLADLGA
ncbi:hypothetical protein [Agromyces kandeliae]|uniref:Acyltransferase n=1 Tax=Agromyces kandeliae TaxID=2666141 RepID=A0A6L5R583_9MICO|nr:hypothetical protein [Agromyces kandeliae]MRX45040.1 hypothetical protein [Agromyces kandeliae]